MKSYPNIKKFAACLTVSLVTALLTAVYTKVQIAQAKTSKIITTAKDSDCCPAKPAVSHSKKQNNLGSPKILLL
ncbi:MAG: hypothetical protein U9N85_10590 [Bacteroidota bacterium]|nr:hypothetical protein [Bacteroidota bacterium]